jgi:hypothetical protein
MPRTTWKIVHDPADSVSAVSVDMKTRLGLRPAADMVLNHTMEAKTKSGSPSSTVVTAFVESRYISADRSITVEGRSRIAEDGINLSVNVSLDGIHYFSREWSKDNKALER